MAKPASQTRNSKDSRATKLMLVMQLVAFATGEFLRVAPVSLLNLRARNHLHLPLQAPCWKTQNQRQGCGTTCPDRVRFAMPCCRLSCMRGNTRNVSSVQAQSPNDTCVERVAARGAKWEDEVRYRPKSGSQNAPLLLTVCLLYTSPSPRD